MIKRIFDTWKLNISELYGILAVIFGAEIFGIIVVAIILHFDETATTCATLGTMMAVFAGALMNIVFGIVAFSYSFNTMVSWGSTRKEFLIVDSIIAYLNLAIEMVALLILYFLETMLYKILYADRECEDIIVFLADYRIILAIIFILPTIRMFCGALVLKFRKKASWFLWAMWIAVCVGLPNCISNAFEQPNSLSGKVVHSVGSFVTGLPGIVQVACIVLTACVFVGGTVLLIRKQAVEA